MARDDDDFRLRPGLIREGGAACGSADAAPVAMRGRASSFAGQIQKAIRRAGGNPSLLSGAGKASGRFNARGAVLRWLRC